MHPIGDITTLLHRWSEGDKQSLDTLMSLVYPRLRLIASRFYRSDLPDPTLGATALVHEAYMRLVQQRRLELSDREHFYSFAAQVMRSILIDHARAQKSEKRGGGRRVPLHEEMRWISLDNEDVIELVEALDELATVDRRKVRLIELRYFLGCTCDEAADIQQISKATVDRDLQLARAWLFRRLKGAPSPSGTKGMRHFPALFR